MGCVGVCVGLIGVGGVGGLVVCVSVCWLFVGMC